MYGLAVVMAGMAGLFEEVVEEVLVVLVGM